jgi:hypothetical protein
MISPTVAVLADAAPKGLLLTAFGVFYVAAMLGVCIAMAFLLRLLYRWERSGWRTPFIVGAWVLLAGSVFGLIRLLYTIVAGEDLPL